MTSKGLAARWSSVTGRMGPGYAAVAASPPMR